MNMREHKKCSNNCFEDVSLSMSYTSDLIDRLAKNDVDEFFKILMFNL